MTSPYRLSVSQFIGHFRSHLDNIAQVPSEHFQKILYSLVLDPLAQAAYPMASSRAKVVRLIENLTSWPDAGRVSAVQLKLALLQEGRARYRLYRHVSRHLKQQPVRLRTLLADSPLKSELLPFAATKQEQGFIDRCTYSNLFYTYRSNLVHEFREPGYGTDWGRGSVQPYYGKSSYGERELVFPLAFVASLANEALTRLEKHLLDNHTAPHSKFKFGSLWRWS